MRGEAGELLGDPVFSLAAPNIPTYLKLVGKKLYWSIWSEEDESGVLRPVGHLLWSEGRFSSGDPSLEASQLRDV